MQLYHMCGSGMLKHASAYANVLHVRTGSLNMLIRICNHLLSEGLRTNSTFPHMQLIRMCGNAMQHMFPRMQMSCMCGIVSYTCMFTYANTEQVRDSWQISHFRVCNTFAWAGLLTSYSFPRMRLHYIWGNGILYHASAYANVLHVRTNGSRCLSAYATV